MSITTSSSRTRSRPIVWAGAALWLLIGLPLPSAEFPSPPSAADRYADERRRMVEQDIRRRGVSAAAVLAALGSIPRERFVPSWLRPFAYADRPLPIGEGQTISQPYIVAYMSEQLQLQPHQTVLEIGTGSGYQTAVLARLAKQVYSIEIIAALSQRADAVLKDLGLANVELRVGDGFFGWPERAPFDAILLTAAAPRLPDPLWQQLREGGRMILPLGEPRQSQTLVRVTKRAGQPVVEDLTGVIFVPLTGAIESVR